MASAHVRILCGAYFRCVCRGSNKTTTASRKAWVIWALAMLEVSSYEFSVVGDYTVSISMSDAHVNVA